MKLYRPPIPIEVKVRVVLRQLGEMWIDDVIRENRFVPRDHRGRSLGKLLAEKLVVLAALLGCERASLRLDHNPALGLRKRRRTGKTVVVGGEVIDVLIYAPAANDPDHLIYRDAHAHHIKTNVRGDGAQFSDTTLMKRERRRKKKSEPMAVKVGPWRKVGRNMKLALKVPIPARANPWGPKGSRSFRRK